VDNFIWTVGILTITVIGSAVGTLLGVLASHLVNVHVFVRLLQKHCMNDDYRTTNLWVRFRVYLALVRRYVDDPPNEIVNDARTIAVVYPNTVRNYYPG
jgi:hypothetical protein